MSNTNYLQEMRAGIQDSIDNRRKGGPACWTDSLIVLTNELQNKVAEAYLGSKTIESNTVKLQVHQSTGSYDLMDQSVYKATIDINGRIFHRSIYRQEADDLVGALVKWLTEVLTEDISDQLRLIRVEEMLWQQK